MTIRTILYWITAGAFVLACPATLRAADMQPGLWEITTTTEMAGMKIPTGSISQCITKADAADDQKMLPKDDKCEVYDMQIQGNRTSWKMRCRGPEAMSGSGSVTFSNTSYAGTVQMSMKGDSGNQMNIVQQYSGRRVGDCKN